MVVFLRSGCMKRKLLPFFLVILVISLGLTGCGKDSGEAKGQEAVKEDNTVYTMRIGALTVAPNQCVTTADEVKKELEAASNGRIKVQVYPAAQLGTAAQLLEGMQAGSVEGAIFPCSFMVSAAPIMGFVEVPGICGKDSESFCRILNADNNDCINELLNKKGLHIASMLITDRSKYMLTKKPVNKMTDVAGMKLWGFPNAYTKVLTEGMGGTSTFFDSSELSVSLQQGTIDGAMAAPTLYAPQKHYEYAKYCLEMPDFTGGNAFILGTAFLDKLPADLKDLVLKTIMDVTVGYEYDYAKTYTEGAVQTMKDNGVTFADVNDAFYAEFQEVYKPMMDIYLEVEGADQLVKKLQALSEAYYAKN